MAETSIDLGKFKPGELYEITLEKVLRPWTEDQLAPLIHDSVLAEIDEQRLIKTGAFRKSIMSAVYEDLHVEVGTNPEDNIFYAVFLEYGTGSRGEFPNDKAVGMAPRAPFRKSILRVEEGLKKIKFRSGKRKYK